MSEAIDKKYLSGLKFRSAKPAKEGSGFVSTERPLTPADVLDWADKGAVVVIVTTDGRKYTVDKNAKPAKDEGGEK